MLAPRKRLWSTPTSAVDYLEKWIPLESATKICDIGCGDGRILLEWAQRLSTQGEDIPTISFIGIDIDSNRIQTCHQRLQELRQSNRIHDNLSIEFVTGNAMESNRLFDDATVFFLYLIPRGLKLMYPLLLQNKAKYKDSTLHVVTYMAKLPNEKVTDRGLLQVSHQPGAAWPLYYYRL